MRPAPRAAADPNPSLQSTYSPSKVVRLLGGWTAVEAEASGLDVAERLGPWLNAFDAIGLQAAQQAVRAIQSPAPGRRSLTPAREAANLAQDLQRLRQRLADAIAQPVDDDGTLAVWQHRQQKLQRDMEQLIDPLRDHARQVLARASTGLRQLAALDAALEQALASRTHKALPAIGALLDRRYKELRRDGATAEDPQAWLERFRDDWRQALLAELDLRLEPVAALAAALHEHTRNLE
ncbi:MAG: DUF3348 family protein [Comamonadaceae bacterium]|nr:MAG: DUF3348 family protein [Comamonadaceae bacterium]